MSRTPSQLHEWLDVHMKMPTGLFCEIFLWHQQHGENEGRQLLGCRLSAAEGEERAAKAIRCWAAQQNPNLRQSREFLAWHTILQHVCGGNIEKLIGPSSMSGMLSSAAVVLSQNTLLRDCGYVVTCRDTCQASRAAGRASGHLPVICDLAPGPGTMCGTQKDLGSNR